MTMIISRDNYQPLGKLPAAHRNYTVLRAVPERNELVVKGRFNNELMRARADVIGLEIHQA